MAGRFSVEATFKAVDNFSAVVGQMSKATDKMMKGLEAGLAKVDHFNNRVMGGLKAVGAAGLAAGAGIGAALLDVARTGAEFEKAMSEVGAISLLSKDQVGELANEALRLGSTTKFSATEVANAMATMGKAGYEPKEIMESIGGVLSAAAAEGMGLADAASIISNTLKGMGLEAKDTARVADVLALTSVRTNSSISSLGESMAIVSSTARQFNFPLEDVVAFVALLQDVGLDASTSATAVSTMLTKISKPTADVAAQMRAMGVSFQDAKGDMLKPVALLQQLAKAGDKAGGNMKQVAFFADLVGLRGDKAVLSLTNLFKAGKVQGLTKELKGGHDIAEKMAALQMDNVSGDLDLMANKAGVLKIRLFNLESGPLRDVTKGVNAWIDANQGLIVSKAAEYAKKIADNLPAIVTWTERIAGGVGAFLAFSLFTKAASIAVEGFQLAMGAASVAGSILAFTIGTVRAIVLSETLATVASTVATGASTAARWLWNAALAIGRLGTAEFTLAQIASTVATAAGTAATWLRTAAQTAWNVLVGVGTTLMGAFSAITSGATIATVAGTAATWLRTAAQTAYNVVVGLGSTALGAFRAATLASTVATIAQSAAFAPLLLTLGAIAAALGAVYLAWDQLNSLKKDTGGLGLTGTIGQMIEQGTWSPATAVDHYYDEQARADAAVSDTSTPSLSSREDYASGAGGYGEITVRAEPGTKATVTKRPTGGFGISLPRSGEFAPGR